MTLATGSPPRHKMRCMEVWGGCQAVEEALATPGLDGWVSSRPHQGAVQGGDVQYVTLCGGGLLTRAIVADVSGHGASVSDLADALRTLMRRNINRKGQSRLVGALNREFTARAQVGRFATAVVATFLAPKRRLTVCNAGHPRPLWYRAASRTWRLLTPEDAAASGANLPLGLDDQTPYSSFAVALGTGDVVLLYTDALTEAADPADHQLGEAGLLDLARSLDPSDPAALGPALLEAVDRHRGGLPADDDVTLLVLRHNGQAPARLSVGQKLDVYAKLFGIRPV